VEGGGGEADRGLLVNMQRVSCLVEKLRWIKRMPDLKQHKGMIDKDNRGGEPRKKELEHTDKLREKRKRKLTNNRHRSSRYRGGAKKTQNCPEENFVNSTNKTKVGEAKKRRCNPFRRTQLQ